MVSADNVNLDVLELIFTYLAGNDLASVALVSRSFFAGVIPRLYCTLQFRVAHAKRYPTLMSPFCAVAAHPEFAIHVRHVDIRTVPLMKTQCNPKFILECTRALALCPNITSFRCSTTSGLPPLLSALQQKDRLRSLRVHANLTPAQATRLARLPHLRDLTLDFPSGSLLNALPRWAGLLQNNLTSLTLFMAHELNETVLESALVELPGLLALHIIGCNKVDHVTVLSLVSHTPNLESLSMTTAENARALPTPPSPLPFLRSLALDARLPPGPVPTTTAVLSAILTHLSAASLTSIILKFPGTGAGAVGPSAPLAAQLLSLHGPSLKTLALVDCAPGTTDTLPALCGGCSRLERLEVAVPVRDLTLFGIALARSTTLRTLVDLAAHTHTHAVRPALTQDGVLALMASVPSLRTVVSGGRVWTRRTGAAAGAGKAGVSLERRAAHAGAVHWFVPRE
ncbi:hypothetical protein FB451DRAFT_1272231 [Mycena latifolia]|nr:hypothetical protein FB451DRAFT_1272231 [Mycena latifolia]